MKTRFVHVLLLGFCAMLGFSACSEEATAHRQPAATTKQPKEKKPAEKAPVGQDAADYVLTFSEEFDSFNPEIWNDTIWYEKSNSTKNYTVEDGKLKIWPQRDASGKFFNRTIDTDGRFEQRYGYFEMEAKLPRGKGTWPAFWLFAHPDKRRPEIDIMEAYPGGVGPWGRTDSRGVAHPTAYGMTVWYDEGVSAGAQQYDAGRDLSEKFHKYAVKWEKDKQTFYFDGKKVHVTEARMPDAKYLMLDLWFGSSSGDPDETTPQGKSNSFEVNYVRVWQFKQEASW